MLGNLNKPYRRSIRLGDYNYSGEGDYFITLCTQNRECLFGQIIDGQMVLNNTGLIIQKWWLALPEKFPEIKLGVFVVMPNHLHGMVEITSARAVREPPLQLPNKLPQQDRRRMSVPKIVGYFKMNSAKEINKIKDATGKAFWQRNYYEHVIVGEKDYNNAVEYINNNPRNWENDRNYSFE